MLRVSIVLVVLCSIFYVQATHSVHRQYDPIDPDTPSYDLLNSDYNQYVTDREEEDDNFSLSISEGVVALAKSFLFSVASKVAALVFGGIAALALCKLTPLCTTIRQKCSSIQEFKSLLKPERLNVASDILKKAVDRYSSLRKEV